MEPLDRFLVQSLLKLDTAYQSGAGMTFWLESIDYFYSGQVEQKEVKCAKNIRPKAPSCGTPFWSFL